MSQSPKKMVLPAPPTWHRDFLSIGITGTNGKTSTTAFIARILRELSSPVVRTTTLGSFHDDEKLDVANSYRGFIDALALGHAKGGRCAAIELTSEALARGFVKAWPCSIGVFTNLTRDHLDAHASAEHYLASKAQLFVHLPKEGTAVLNACDPASDLLAQVTPKAASILRYGVKTRGEPTHAPDLEATRVISTWEGTTIAISANKGLEERFGKLPEELRIPAIGEIFAENALAGYLAGLAASVPPEAAANALSDTRVPAGRFEVVATKPYVVVDFAHTPDAMSRTIATARSLTNGSVTVVFGAGASATKASGRSWVLPRL